MQVTKEIAVIGHLSIDKIKVEEKTYDQMLGGAVLYSALAMERPDNRIHIISTYCEDFNVQLINKTVSQNISLRQLLPILGKQRRAFMEYTKDFERTSHNHAREEWLKDTLRQSPRHVPYDELDYDAVMLVPMLPEISNLYLDWFRNHTQAMIAFDTSEYFAQHYKSEIIEIMKKVDLFIPSDVELNYLFPENNGDIVKHINTLREYGLQKFIIKMSTQGSVIVDGNDISYCGIRLIEAVDATGAGDSFAGALVARYIETKDLVDATKYASVVASLCVEIVGFQGLIHKDGAVIEEEMNRIKIEMR